MRIFLFFLLVFTWPCLVSGQTGENIKGVSIAEDTLPPHESAILDARSINKGVKFPSLSYEEMMSWETGINSSQGLSASSNGLVVFLYTRQDANEVELSLIRGFYYWSHSETLNRGTWVQIAQKKAVYPPGAVIAYSGKVHGLFDASGNGLPGTRMEGWHICNGRNNTPDLSARFVTSFSDKSLGQQESDVMEGYALDDFGATRSRLYDPATGSQQNTRNKDYHFIDINEIPEHDHLAETESIKDYIRTSEALGGNFRQHTHPIETKYPHHKHKYKYTRREYGGDGARDRRSPYVGVDKPNATIRRGLKWRMTNTRENNAAYTSDHQQMTATTYAVAKLNVESKQMSFPPLSSDNISTNNESDCMGADKYARQRAIDLRPSYYVVLYLIKL